MVRSWNYKTPNYIYVVLSSVRTLNGLLICEKLNHTKSFKVDKTLLKEEDWLRGKEEELIAFLRKIIII